MRSSLSNPASPSTLNFQGVTVSLILAERDLAAPGHAQTDRTGVLAGGWRFNGAHWLCFAKSSSETRTTRRRQPPDHRVNLLGLRSHWVPHAQARDELSQRHVERSRQALQR